MCVFTYLISMNVTLHCVATLIGKCTDFIIFRSSSKCRLIDIWTIVVKIKMITIIQKLYTIYTTRLVENSPIFIFLNNS